MDATVAAWLAVRLESLRAADSRHLVTVGWHWPHFAGLPSNRSLDFQQFHHYGARSLNGLQQTLDLLLGLRSIFPDRPIVLGEFGYSNASSSSPELSQPVAPSLTALYEGALLCGLRAKGFAGGFKWMLNDLKDADHNPWESNFGVFQVGDQPKAIRDLMLRLADLWEGLPTHGSLNLLRDATTGLAYRYTLPDSTVVGGVSYHDEALVWQSRDERPAHLFLGMGEKGISLESTERGHLVLGPGNLISGWDRLREAVLCRRQGAVRVELRRFSAGQDPSWEVLPGVSYLVSPGALSPTLPPPDDVAQLEPGHGEHVLILPDSDRYLDAALTYIRHFSPDFTFAPDQVGGRWPYVTVVGGPDLVSDAHLEAIRAHGPLLVERVAGDSVTTTKELLTDMAVQGRRFLGVPPDPPESPVEETYVVQPGDTLSGISLQVYGDRRYWRAIFEANRDVLDDPGRIHPGQLLRLPPRP
jgi:hypothetical protein